MDSTASFRTAEAALFASVGLSVTERTLTLPHPPGRARVLEAGSGRPILHVHGGGGFAGLMAPLAARLDGRQILVDRPGCGLTPWVPLAGVPLREHAVGFLTGVLDALGLDAVDVVANSMGGLWSLWLALDAPDRVRSLALLGAPAMVGGTSAPLPLRLLGRPGIGAVMMAMEPPSAAQVDVLWARMGNDPARVPAPVSAAMLASERLPDYARAWRDLVARMTTWTGTAADVALSLDALRAVRCPVTVIWGANDAFGDIPAGRRIAAALHDAPFTEVPGAGHLPWLEDLERCATAVRAPRAQDRVLAAS